MAKLDVRPPGRPPLDPHDPSVPVTVSLPSKQLKAAQQQADQERVSVQDWIRRVLRDAAAG